MNKLKRQEHILNKLKKNGEVYVVDLAVELGVTTETIRKDLSSLEESNKITKIHGGAIPPQNNAERQFIQRLENYKKQKIAIGKKASTLLKPNDTIFIDSCTTTLYFAQNIPTIKLTIFVNSVLIAHQIWERNPYADIHLLGGKYYGELQANLGVATLCQMENIFTDYAFIGAGAIDLKQGIMVKNIEEGNVAQQMLRQSRHKIILSDSSKFYKKGIMRIATMNDIDFIITDSFPQNISTEYAKNIMLCD